MNQEQHAKDLTYGGAQPTTVNSKVVTDQTTIAVSETKNTNVIEPASAPAQTQVPEAKQILTQTQTQAQAQAQAQAPVPVPVPVPVPAPAPAPVPAPPATAPPPESKPTPTSTSSTAPSQRTVFMTPALPTTVDEEDDRALAMEFANNEKERLAATKKKANYISPPPESLLPESPDGNVFTYFAWHQHDTFR